jgi:hypothetical protein
MAGPTNVLWYSSVAAQLLFFVHLLWSRLAKKHPIFALYLGCSVVFSLGAIYFMSGAKGDFLPLSYTYFWLWAEPVLVLLQIGVALEVHSALWKEYASMVRPVRPLLIFSLVMALVASALPLKVELGQFGTLRLQTIMQFEFVAKRYISMVLAIFLVFSALLFLIVIRDSLTIRLFRHESMLAVYFGIYAVVVLLVNIGWTSTPRVNSYLASALTLCFVAWISVFKPGQEPQDST